MEKATFSNDQSYFAFAFFSNIDPMILLDIGVMKGEGFYHFAIIKNVKTLIKFIYEYDILTNLSTLISSLKSNEKVNKKHTEKSSQLIAYATYY